MTRGIRGLYLSCRKKVNVTKLSVVAILFIVCMNIKFGDVAHQELNKRPSWTQTTDVSSITTFLNPPPPWKHQPSNMRQRDILNKGEVKNDTIKKLLKMNNDANNVIRKATFDNKKGYVGEIMEISPLLYGGFIEHMGRVIDGNFGNDGGIWAELISDRKFYYNLSPSHDMHTLSPWLVREGVDSSVYSPRSKTNSPFSLVRGGRVIVMQFPCISRDNKRVDKKTVKDSFRIEEDDETEVSNGDTLDIGPWRAELEQSGLGLNKGRAYRGYVWLSTAGLPSLDNMGSGSGRDDLGNKTLSSDQSVRLTDDSSLLILEVWLNIRHHNKGKYKPRLLARISNQELNTMKEKRLGEEGENHIEREPSNKNMRERGQYQGIQYMERLAKWRKFNFGFEWLEEDIAACACGVTNEADCAGDCRSGVGNGGFNNQNLNGAKPGVGEDKLGYCGECGAAITIVGRRVELKGRQSNTEGTDDINCVSQTSSMRSSNESISYIPSILIGAISLIPSDAEHGIFRSETMELLRTLRPTIMRWPGGNFVSGYNWVKCVCYKGGRDGIGPRDSRPTRKNSAWAGIVSNDFGVHEFMLLCSLIDALPMIVVNSGLGSAIEAASLVSYVNTPIGQNFLADHDLRIPHRNSLEVRDSRDRAFRRDLRSRLGKMMHEEPRRRARNGEMLPWNCKWWAIGNEMYGEWQLGHVPFNEYRERHIRFSEAMRAVSSNIKLVGVGALHLPVEKETHSVNLDGGDFGFNSSWTGRMMKELSGGHYLDAVSEHFYVDEEKPLAATHAKQASWRVSRFASAYRGLHRHLKHYMEAHNLRLPATFPGICLDEFGYWYGPAEFGQLGTRSSLKDALGVAVAVHAMMRNADVYAVATYSQSVNVFGAIKTTKHSAALDPIGLLLSLYSRVFAYPNPSPNNKDDTYEKGRNKLNVAEFGAPTAPSIRALSLRGFSDLKLVDIEIEGIPHGYAAGSAMRLIDAVAAIRTDQTNSNTPPRSKLTISFVNLFDANVVSIRISKEEVIKLLKMENQKLKHNSYKMNLHVSMDQIYGDSQAKKKEEEREELLVGRCWALHDSCLTDKSSSTTMSPSCPDHTAMNMPSADWLTSLKTPNVDTDRGGDGGDNIVNDIGDGDSSVVLSRVPPEWTKADNILRIVDNLHLETGSVEKVNQEIDKYEKINKETSRLNKNYKKEKISNIPQDGTQDKGLRDDQFLFVNEVSLIPLSATACEFELLKNIISE